MKLSTRAIVIAGAVLLGLSACVPTPAPAPTTPSGTTPTPTVSPSDPEDAEATAAAVVVTARTLSVVGTDGSTLAAVTYDMDAAAAVAQIAEALDEEPVATPIPGDVDSPCPPATGYDFGGLQVRSPGSLWSAGALEAIVTGATTSGGVGIETTAGQRTGVTQPAFEAAVGEFIAPYEGQPERLGFDILNPEAGPYDRIGTYAEFSGGQLVYLATPNRLGFIGSCA